MTAGRPPSPLDCRTEPARLTARVVDPGPPARLLGYDVEADLARHYGFVHVVGLLSSGELPEPGAARALDIALSFLAPVSVGDAPGHVGILSRVCGVRFAATLGLAATTLAEEAAFVLEEHAEWLDWLAAPADRRAPAPARFLAATEEDRASVARLRTALDAAPFAAPGLSVGPARTAGLLAVLAACGLSREGMQTAWVLARLPAVAAEAAARPVLNVRDYPLSLPPLDYREGE